MLVYQSGTSHDSLVETLSQIDHPFRIYGLRRGITEPEVEGNLTFCPFSEDGFIEDLATCRAVIAGGGFTLMGEAIFMQKPMLSVPLVGQFEQVLNATYLEKLGYGERADAITKTRMERFLDPGPRYAEALSQTSHDDNAGILSTLESALVQAADQGPHH